MMIVQFENEKYLCTEGNANVFWDNLRAYVYPGVDTIHFTQIRFLKFIDISRS